MNIDDILNKQISEEEVKNILDKFKPLSEVYGKNQPYDNFEICKEVMFTGIEALKHNYSNN